jgi:hypothetical protein
MKSILSFLFLFCCIHAVSAQTISDTDIDLLSTELSKQAIARNALKLAVLDFAESNEITDFSLAVSEELRIHMAVNNAALTAVFTIVQRPEALCRNRIVFLQTI